MKKSALFACAAVAVLGMLMAAGCRKNPHDNTREPDPWTDKPVENHHFDGGATDPYGREEKGAESGDQGHGGGGEGSPHPAE